MLEGNAGDLKVGLPWQSVHDGTRFVHEPLRLNVFIEAPLDALNGVIAKARERPQPRRQPLAASVRHGRRGRVSHRYRGDLQWEKI